jgi:DNA-binding response OmpR family regulator
MSEPNTIPFKAVLLVDDDRQLAVTLQWILADENFLVDVAYDGAEALEKVRSIDYDAVVCDIMMPRLRGDEFYYAAKQYRPEIADRFIFITGHGADLQLNRFLLDSGVKYLLKPFPVSGLINCVKELIA